MAACFWSSVFASTSFCATGTGMMTVTFSGCSELTPITFCRTWWETSMANAENSESSGKVRNLGLQHRHDNPLEGFLQSRVGVHAVG